MRNILLLIFLFICTSLFAQEEFIGVWDTEIQTWEDEFEDTGVMELKEDGSCVVVNQFGTGHYEWWIDGEFFFLAGLGYTYEFKDDKLVLIPAYGESEFKFILLEKND